jgi:prevent-host-death family protein
MRRDEHNDTEMSVAEVRANLAEVVNAAIRGRTTYITNRGRRVAAVVALEIAEGSSRTARPRRE